MADHRFTLPGMREPEVLVRTKPFGFPVVLVDGATIDREVRGGRSIWTIPTGDGPRQLVIRGALTGLQGAVDGELIRIERRLAMWELGLALAPISLAALGIVSGLTGLVAAILAMRLVRLAPTAPARLGVLLANLTVTTALGYALYVITWR